MKTEHLNANRDLWNARVKAHTDSDFYNNDAFLNGKTSLNNIETDILGDIAGKKVLHLQCHFGQDSLSLARMGAQVTGLDFSEEAIKMAKSLNTQLGLDARFVCSNVLDAAKNISEEFDLIFTSYGTIGWISDLNKYFDQVSSLLKPNGTFLIVDFHPFIWMYNSEFSQLDYSYFNTGVIEEEAVGSYAAPHAHPEMKEFGWNHSLGEIFEGFHNKLTVQLFKEFDFSPYPIFKDSIKTSQGFQIKGLEGMLPIVYALKAQKM